LSVVTTTEEFAYS